MTSTESIERTSLVNDRDIKRHSCNLHSIHLPLNHSNRNKQQEEATGIERPPGHHCHKYSMLSGRRKKEEYKAKLKLYVASGICLIFMTGEIIGGYIAGSLAVIMDAAHVLVDILSFLISIFSLWLSSKPPSKRLTYGWYRAEILGAFLSMLIIWIVTAVLLYLAVLRVLHPHYEIESSVMLITAGCAVIANIILSLILHQSGHRRCHSGHSSIGQRSAEAEENVASGSTSVRAAFIHAIGDVFQSISVLVSALIIFFKPEYKIADPICTFIFSIVILGTTFSILQDILLVLMEGTPKCLSYDTVKERILAIEKVKSVHSLHLWCLTMNQIVLSAHVVTADSADKQQILNKITEALFDAFNFHTVTLQIELAADQRADCAFCQDPSN